MAPFELGSDVMKRKEPKGSQTARALVGQAKFTPAFVKELLAVVRKRPRGLDLPFSLWSCQRLADYLAEQTGLRVSDETIRRQLAEYGIALSRPQHKVSSPDLDYEVKKGD